LERAMISRQHSDLLRRRRLDREIDERHPRWPELERTEDDDDTDDEETDDA